MSLVDSTWLDHVILSILLISVLGGFNPFTFKVISHKEGLLLFCDLFSVCFRVFFFVPYFPIAVFFCAYLIFCSEVFTFPSCFLLAIVFLVTMGITFFGGGITFKILKL